MRCKTRGVKILLPATLIFWVRVFRRFILSGPLEKSHISILVINTWEYTTCVTKWGSGLVYTISDYFLCRIAFLNPVQKRIGVWVLTRSPENSPVTPFRAKIISSRLSYLLFSLPISRALDQPHLLWSHPFIKARVGSVSYRITMFTLETKRCRLYWIHFRTTCWCGAEL